MPIQTAYYSRLAALFRDEIAQSLRNTL